MLLVAFSFLPFAVQHHVAILLRDTVCAPTVSTSPYPAADWVALLVDLNPVVSWHPAEEHVAFAGHSCCCFPLRTCAQS